MQQQPTVLIAGAGPTGLVLAIWLTKAGIPVRIIDRAGQPGTTSRATVVQARTLELYHQMGIDTITIERGIVFKAANIWVRGRKAARLPFGTSGTGISPYPYVLIFPQDRHEQMLTEHLEQLGIPVERSTELISFEDTAGGIRAQLRMANGETEACTATYLAGCDGAHSFVRHRLGISFPGGTYEGMFYVADLKIKGAVANGEMNAALDEADFLFVFPMQGEGRVRLVGAIRQTAEDQEHLQWEDVSDGIIKRMKMEVEEVRWFSTYKVHHRVAAQFRQNNVFLLGDAGHVHSPVGGQGMNTGIGDAINLAWKISAVVKGGAPDALLDTYEQERIAFARQLVASTDRAFSFVDKRSFLATQIRTRIMPALLRLLFRLGFFRRLAFLTVSQTKINYRQSALSSGEAGRIRGGDRLPWVRGDAAAAAPDNFTPLTTMDWQLHCYGTASPALREQCLQAGVPLHVFKWSDAAKAAGLRQDAAYIIRPDGYIGLTVSDRCADQVAAYLNTWGIGNRAQ